MSAILVDVVDDGYYVCSSPPSQSGDTFVLSAKVWQNQQLKKGRFFAAGHFHSVQKRSISGSKNAFVM